ncbi:MAG: hypothetical protein LC802_05000 [Acidobacteria bacterium]|nr:hypothetical protein [Acidobacteriota bacterium]
MNRPPAHAAQPLALSARLAACLLFFVAVSAPAAAAPQGFAQQKGPPAKAPAQGRPAAAAALAATPTETVRAMYKALAERRFREAFALSVLHAAVESLSAEEFAELQPDFERLAAATPANVEVTGEVLNGEVASVFIKPIDRAAEAQAEEVKLLRAGGRWVIGERGDYEVVGKEGKDFLFRARIETHHAEVEEMLKRISAAEFVYASQHGGAYGDLVALVGAGLVPQDLLGTESTGYRIMVTLGKGGKSWAAGAEPVRYGRTGRLSFRMDQSGLSKKDAGGKPLKGSSK